jgi:EAL domain-containing protein (putative c-di-GMP-specific phosphodiesterase class I)
VLLADIADEADAHAAVARLEAELRAPFALDGVAVTIGGSFGLALPTEAGEDGERLLQRADDAMYAVKSASRRAGLHNGTLARHGQLPLLRELERAIDHHEFVLHYQPKVDMRSGDVLGVEALVRWAHPKRGLVLPGEFIAAAEQTDLMVPLTSRVLDDALVQCAQWRRDGLPLTVSVNVSARNLRDPEFPRLVEQLLRVRGIDPAWLELELAEAALLEGRDEIGDVLGALRTIGVTLAIDDFGAGPSSFAHLRDLPFDRVKLDRSFVGELDGSEASELIVATTIELAEKLGVGSVAEGIEDERSWEHLARLGCDLAQGYWIARPAPGDVITLWTRRVRDRRADDAA